MNLFTSDRNRKKLSQGVANGKGRQRVGKLESKGVGWWRHLDAFGCVNLTKPDKRQKRQSTKAVSSLVRRGITATHRATRTGHEQSECTTPIIGCVPLPFNVFTVFPCLLPFASRLSPLSLTRKPARTLQAVRGQFVRRSRRSRYHPS